MANFKEALEYAANNPQSDFARAFGVEVSSGRHDAEAKKFGIDTTPIKEHFKPLIEQQIQLAKEKKEIATDEAYAKTRTGGLKGLGLGMVKGVLSTFKGLSQIGTKIGNLFLPKSLELEDKYSEEALAADAEKGSFRGKLLNEKNLEARGAAEKIGKFAEQVAEFFIPAGKVAQVEKLLAGGAKAATFSKLAPLIGEKAANVVSKAAPGTAKVLVRAGEGGGVITLQSGGDLKEAGAASLVGGAMVPAGAVLTPVVKFGAKAVAGGAKRLAGALSGRGTAVIDEVLKNPKAALEGLSGESLETLSKDAKRLKEAAVNMKAEAGKEYKRVLSNLQEIYENEMKPKGFVFDKGTEINKITDLLDDKFGIKKMGKLAEETGEEVADKGELDFIVTRFQKPNEQNTIKNALKFIKAFRDPLSPRTMEGMASTIDKMKGSDAELNSVLHTITSSLRDSVAKMGEEAGYVEGANLARNFAQAMDKIDDFTAKFKATAEDLRPDAGAEVAKVGEFRKGQPVILPEVEKTKIIQDLSTLFSGNKDADKDTLRKLVFGGQELLSREAGRTLATATEKASSKLGDFIREAIITPILSPTAIGQIAARTKLSSSKVVKLIEALKKLDPAKRGAIIKIISDNND